PARVAYPGYAAGPARRAVDRRDRRRACRSIHADARIDPRRSLAAAGRSAGAEAPVAGALSRAGGQLRARRLFLLEDLAARRALRRRLRAHPQPLRGETACSRLNEDL